MSYDDTLKIYAGINSDGVKTGMTEVKSLVGKGMSALQSSASKGVSALSSAMGTVTKTITGAIQRS